MMVRVLGLMVLALAALLIGESASAAAEPPAPVPYEPLQLPAPASQPSFSLYLFQDLSELCEDPTLSARLPKSAKADGQPAPATVEEVQKRPDSAGVVLLELLQACTAVNNASGLTRDSLATLRAFRDMTRAERRLWIALAQHAKAKLEQLPATANWRAVFKDFQIDEQGSPESPLGLLGGDAAGLEQRLIAGLGQFLAERAKRELTAYLADQLRAACEKDVKALPPAAKVSDFAPQLCALLDSESDAGVALFALGRMLRAAAKADLERLPDYLLWRGQAANGDAAGAALAARVMLQIGLELRGGAEPLRLLASLEALQTPSSCAGSCQEMVPVLQRVGRYTAIAEPILRLAADGQALSPYAFAAVALTIDKQAPLPEDAQLPE